MEQQRPESNVGAAERHLHHVITDGGVALRIRPGLSGAPQLWRRAPGFSRAAFATGQP